MISLISETFYFLYHLLPFHNIESCHIMSLGLIVQSVLSQTADPGVLSSIPAGSLTLVVTDHEIISVVILLSLMQEVRLSDTRESILHQVLINYQGKVWLDELII